MNRTLKKASNLKILIDFCNIVRFNRTSELSKHYWVTLTDGATASKERFYTTVHAMHSNSVAAKERLTETWTSGRTKLEDTYGYISELVIFGKDYTVQIVAPLRKWVGDMVTPALS